MADMARWGHKVFFVSPSQIITLENLTTSVSIKTDSENDTSGTAPTNTRGLELQPVSFSATYRKATGSDPLAEWNEWHSLVGSKYPLYIGGKRFGPASLILQSIATGEIILSDSGEITSLTINFTFEEDANGQTSKLVENTSQNKTGGTSATSTTSTASKAAATYAATVEKRRAMAATASATDKARLSS